jgi:DNA polymerase-1
MIFSSREIIFSVQILIARTEADILRAFKQLSKADALGCDTETSGFNSRTAKLFSIQFSDGDFNVLVPISEGVAIDGLASILASQKIIKIFHNAKFDLEFLHDAGHTVNNVFDTMVAEKVITKGAQQSSSLAETLYRYFAVDLDKSQRAKFNRNWDGVWTDELVNYALSDVVHLPDLMRKQKAWLEKLGLTEIYSEQIRKAVEG